MAKIDRILNFLGNKWVGILFWFIVVSDGTIWLTGVLDQHERNKQIIEERIPVIE